MLITHDRAFLDAWPRASSSSTAACCAATPATSPPTSATKARELAAEALASARADKLLAQEEVWIRKGVEARRTRSVARMARLEVLRASARHGANRSARCGWKSTPARPAARSWPSCATCRCASASGHRRPLQRHHPARRQGRPDRPNGAGKTTLLKLILGELQPDRRQRAPRQQAAGGLLRPDARARPRRDAGRHHQPGQRVGRDRRPAQARDELPERLPVLARARQLAGAHAVGGERNRLLLARLFALPANVLVLDEPTNDLDIDTLELLEELLQDYAGTVFLVSHDRRFLDNVVTSTDRLGGRSGIGPACGASTKAATRTGCTQRARARGCAGSGRAVPAAGTAAPAPAVRQAAQAQLQGAARARRTARAHRGAGGRAEGDRRDCRRALYVKRRRSASPSSTSATRRSTRNCWRRWSAGRRSRGARSEAAVCGLQDGLEPAVVAALRHRVGAADDQAPTAGTAR
jgi:ATP-binding cassette subfamily F protein uup